MKVTDPKNMYFVILIIFTYSCNRYQKPDEMTTNESMRIRNYLLALNVSLSDTETKYVFLFTDCLCSGNIYNTDFVINSLIKTIRIKTNSANIFVIIKKDDAGAPLWNKFHLKSKKQFVLIKDLSTHLENSGLIIASDKLLIIPPGKMGVVKLFNLKVKESENIFGFLKSEL